MKDDATEAASVGPLEVDRLTGWDCDRVSIGPRPGVAWLADKAEDKDACSGGLTDEQREFAEVEARVTWRDM